VIRRLPFWTGAGWQEIVRVRILVDANEVSSAPTGLPTLTLMCSEFSVELPLSAGASQHSTVRKETSSPVAREMGSQLHEYRLSRSH
jgi:hypothetical protein